MSKENESKILILTIWERLTLCDMIGTERGTAGHYYKCAKLLDILEFDDKERIEIELAQLANGRVLWKENVDGTLRTYTLEFADTNYKLLIAIARRYQNWPVDRTGRTGLLLEKLDIVEEE